MTKLLSLLRYKISMLMIFICLFFSNQSYCQSLLEKTGGIKTNFAFTSNDKNVTILSQGIIQRGVYDYSKSEFINVSYGYGYGLQNYFLEISTTSPFTTNYRPKEEGKKKGKYYRVKLLDKNGETLVISRFYTSKVRKVDNENKLITYSFNLKNIPMILLDQTSTINLEKISNYK